MQRWLKVFLGSLVVVVPVSFLIALALGWQPWNALSYLQNRNKPPIRIGLIHSLSGPLALSEKSLLDVEIMAIDELNAVGGIGGRQIVYSAPDCRSEPSAFAVEARRLLDGEKVAALFGCWTSESRKAVLPVLDEMNGLLFFPGNFEGMERSSRIIYAGGAANQSVLPTVRWAYDSLNSRKFFVVGLEEVWSRCSSEIAKDGIKAAGGELVGEKYMIAQAPAIEAIVQAIAQAKPDVVLNFMYGESNLAFYTAMRRAGLASDKQAIIAFGFAEDESRRFQQADIINQYAAWNYFQSVDRPENRAFIKKFQAKFDGNRVIGDPMIAAYNSIKFWARSAGEVGSDNIKALTANLPRQSMDAPDGIVTIDGDSQAVWRPFHVGRYSSTGQFQIIWSIEKPIRPVLYVGTRTQDQWITFLDDLRTHWQGRWSASPDSGPAPVLAPASR